MGSTQAPMELYKSERLLYRAPEDSAEDKEFFHRSIINDKTIQTMSTMRLKRPSPKAATDAFIKSMQEAILGVLICLPVDTPEEADTAAPESSMSNPTTGPKTIPIGHINIFNRFGPDTAHHRNAMLGISFAEGHRGKGYGGEAINWALDWAFQHGGFHRIYIGAFSFNTNALKLYRKLGFVDEGREREAVLHLRKWHDIVNLSILEHEWEVLRAVDSDNSKET